MAWSNPDSNVFQDTLTANGSTERIENAAGYVQPQAARICSVQAVGTWGSGTLTPQMSNDGTNWVAMADSAGTAAQTLTADGVIELPVIAARFIRFTLAGATAPSLTITACVRF